MKDVGSEQSQDEFPVEITDLDKPGTAAHRSPHTASRARFVSRRYRLPVTVVTVSMVVLAILLILGTATPVRELVGSLLVRHTSTPTPVLPLFPGEDLFYVQAEPSWGHLFIDGHAVAHPPVVSVDSPLRLSRGRHALIWRAEPFQDQQCTLSVPPRIGTDTCEDNQSVQTKPGVFASIIRFSESLDMLPGEQRTALVKAAQDALDAQQSTDTVQPGELYALSPRDAACKPTAIEPSCYAVARQSLAATLRFQLDTNAASPETCLDPEPGCTFLHQNCYVFCPLGADTMGSWDVFAPVLPLWTFATQSGQVIERDVPGNSLWDYATGQMADESLQELDITWDHQAWQVVVPTNGGVQAFGFLNPVCAIANSETQFLNPPADANGPIYLQWQFASDGVLAAGCVGVGSPAQPLGITPTPTQTPSILAYCLQRFGVLLAANDVAHRIWPNLPLADAYEQRLAQQLAASLSGVQP